MKKLIALCLLIVGNIYAQTDQLTFSAIIKNRNSDSLTVQSKGMKKVIVADKKGNFKDSFAVDAGLYQVFDGKEYTMVYLDNSYNLTMTLDAKAFDKTLKYTGKGARENNFLAEKMRNDGSLIGKLQDNPKGASKVMDERQSRLESKLADTKMSTAFRTMMGKVLSQEKMQIDKMIKKMIEGEKMVGKPSASFTYENHKGGTTSLKDFRGKYVYIDVWATWCGPCIGEIPHLQKLEKEFHGKKIAFVSISVDKQKSHDKWSKFVDKRSLGGVQLMADKDWKSDFIKSYGIQSIPRFILLDPKGNIVKWDAARPSDPRLKTLLNKLLK
ncbi:MAG: thioredoxin [Flavobacterium sp. MedPE-SWcel]|uniref:TlpA family protein disulfide reductase n=1 Tax=uncultured Flavobacterium sp. TaxID=165435 RepID=UPI00091687A6|nr:TlpA disulfide reductase family protein [uncultured Flavobacterium sp.]OIQ16017.1 MAG: thioredoxin [Flavobacterium sp. MedPE-SWcel]